MSTVELTESIAPLPSVPKRDVSGFSRFPANESLRRTGLHLSLSAKSNFYLPEISRSCRTASDGSVGGGSGWARIQIIRQHESLNLYKSLNTLCCGPCRNPLWFTILDKQAGSWGLNTLRRDILAEKFVTKIFKDGVRRHMADPKVP